MKIFAVDDYAKVINSSDYKRACTNCQFNMLENRLTNLPQVIQHILWTDNKVKQWEKECPSQHLVKEYNNWLENKFNEYKQSLMIKEVYK